MKCVEHGCRDWRTAGQRDHEPCSRPEDTIIIVMQSDQLGGQTADRYSSLGDCGSVHEP